MAFNDYIKWCIALRGYIETLHFIYKSVYD